MLIKNTEPATFARLVYHNTKPLTVNRPVGTFRFGGLLWAVGIAWVCMLIMRLHVLWFPLCLACVLGVFLAFDILIGTLNTLTELKVLNSMEAFHDHSGEAGQEEGGLQEGEDGTGAGV
jgi:hypothetical protein